MIESKIYDMSKTYGIWVTSLVLRVEKKYQISSWAEVSTSWHVFVKTFGGQSADRRRSFYIYGKIKLGAAGYFLIKYTLLFTSFSA